MKYYIISGEVSGDLHGSNLIKSIIKIDNKANFRAWGGEKMKAAGATIAKDISELSIMGIFQVLKKLPMIFKNFQFCHNDIINYKPDAIILIDYSGFNLRIAKWAKKRGFKVFYYILPQVWATRASRVKKIKKYVDIAFSTLHFEKEFYQKYDCGVEYVGHPLKDIIENYQFDADFLSNFESKPIIALLPGSRKQELHFILPEMIKVVSNFPEYQFILAKSSNIPLEYYQNKHNITFVEGKTYDLLKKSKAALVTSGTATLETAIIGTPQIVCYKTNWLFYLIVKIIIKIPFISLVNIIMGRKIVPELIQGNLNYKNLSDELKKITQDKSDRDKMLENYNKLKLKLGDKGAPDITAKKIIEYLEKPNN